LPLLLKKPVLESPLPLCKPNENEEKNKFYVIEFPSTQHLAISTIKDEVIVLIIGISHKSEFEPSGTSLKCIYRVSKKEDLIIEYVIHRIEQLVKRGNILCYILNTSSGNGHLYDIEKTVNSFLQNKKIESGNKDFSYTLDSMTLTFPRKLHLICGNGRSYTVSCKISRVGFVNGFSPYVLIGLNTKNLCNDSVWCQLYSGKLS